LGKSYKYELIIEIYWREVNMGKNSRDCIRTIFNGGEEGEAGGR
jgi:hypothetical protein